MRAPREFAHALQLAHAGSCAVNVQLCQQEPAILPSWLSSEAVVDGFTHGDLIPGNLLVADGRLTGIIDWGGAGYGDTAQDLAPAWAVLDAGSRSVFRDAVGAYEAAWIRARTFELEHAVGGVLYYVPRGHTLGDVMMRTLERILHG